MSGNACRCVTVRSAYKCGQPLWFLLEICVGPNHRDSLPLPVTLWAHNWIVWYAWIDRCSEGQ